MKCDLVSRNGKLVNPAGVGFPDEQMLSVNFVYQKIHALAHKSLHPETHAELLEISCNTLYGCSSGLTAAMLEDEIMALLRANRYPEGSIQVMLYLFPTENEKVNPVRIISCEKQLLYKGYTLWHSSEKAIVLPYESPFLHFQTALSLTAHNYAANYAHRNGANCVLSESSLGILYSVGENPLFAVLGSEIITPGIEDGACDSVQRRLGIAAAEKAGFKVEERSVTSGKLPEYQELFAVTPSGITSIGECEGNLYSHSAAATVAGEMDRMRTAIL